MSSSRRRRRNPETRSGNAIPPPNEARRIASESDPDGFSSARSGAVGPSPAEAPDPRAEPPGTGPAPPPDAVPTGGARPHAPAQSPQSLPSHTDHPESGHDFEKILDSLIG